MTAKEGGILLLMNLKEQFPLSITASASNKTAHIRISGYIADWSASSAFNLAKAIDDYLADGVTACVLHINSPGGRVFEATEIVNEIKRFDTVSVKIGALAASAATFIACSFDDVSASKNSQLMIHKPKGSPSGDEDEIKAYLKMITGLTRQYEQVYAAKTGKSVEEIATILSGGDTWMTAQEAKADGFIDSIVGEEKITEDAYLSLVACGCPVAKDFKPKPKKEQNMNLAKMAQLVGLPESATEAEVEAKVKELQNSQGTPDDIQDAVDKVTAMHQAAIKTYLDGAEASKKINAEQRKSFETLAAVDFPKVTAIIDAMPEGGAPITEQLESGNGGNQEQERTYAWYQQHPTAWDELVENDPEKAEALAEAHYEEV